jgi:hypothetical protein
MQEQPFMLAVVPSLSRYPDPVYRSQKSDFSVPRRLGPSSRVDLPDDHIFIPVSKSASCVSQCRCLVRVYRDKWGGFLVCPVKVISK